MSLVSADLRQGLWRGLELRLRRDRVGRGRAGRRELRVADRRRGEFLRAHVLEHNQTVLRLFLGQAGAAVVTAARRGRGGNHRSADDDRTRPTDVDLAAPRKAVTPVRTRMEVRPEVRMVMAGMRAAADVTDEARAADAHSDLASASAAVEAGTCISRVGRQGRSGEATAASASMVVRNFGNMSLSWGRVCRGVCFGYWPLRPAESVHSSVRFLSFTFRRLTFIRRSSRGFGSDERTFLMLRRKRGVRRAWRSP